MRRLLVRPWAVCLPLAGIFSCLWGSAALTWKFFLIYFAVQLLSLCAPAAFRNAAARQASPRRLGLCFGAGFLPIFLAVLLCGLLIDRLPLDRLASALWPMADSSAVPLLTRELGWSLTGAAGLILIEQMFEEQLCASGHATDGGLLALLSGVLLGLGLILDGSGNLFEPVPALYTLLGALISMLIGLIAVLVLARPRAFSLLPRLYGYGPRACVQTLLYPAAVLALSHFTLLSKPAALYGLLLWQLLRTNCRRSHAETAAFTLWIALLCAAPMLLSVFFPHCAPYAQAALLAALCAALVFAVPTLPLCASMLLLLCVQIVPRCIARPDIALRVLRPAAPALALLIAALRPVRLALLRRRGQ